MSTPVSDVSAVQPDPAVVEPPLHTLASLVSALGPATFDEALALVDGHDKPSLVREGSMIATPRISTDAARIHGQAYDFLARANDDQLDHLPAFNREWLRIAVWAANEGDSRYQQFNGQVAGAAAKQSTASADADHLRLGAEAKRDQLHAALAALAGGSPALLVSVAKAYGTAADLSGSIQGQVDLARTWLRAPSGSLVQRLKTTRLDEAWLVRAEALAKGYAVASSAAGATRSQGSIAGADVDHLDGINLVLLRSLAAQFEAAHAADPAIPRLTFNALRSHVHRSHHAAPAAPAPGSSAVTTA